MGDFGRREHFDGQIHIFKIYDSKTCDHLVNMGAMDDIAEAFRRRYKGFSLGLRHVLHLIMICNINHNTSQ